MQLAESEGKGVIERNEEFLKNKNTKLSKQISSEMKQCTFVPKVQKTKAKPKEEDTEKLTPGERLYAYFEKYEKHKEDCRQKLLNA